MRDGRQPESPLYRAFAVGGFVCSAGFATLEAAIFSSTNARLDLVLAVSEAVIALALARLMWRELACELAPGPEHLSQEGAHDGA